MSFKLRLLQKTKVYDKKAVKGPPILELDEGAELQGGNKLMKRLKPWLEVTLPDGRQGLIPGETKIQILST